jgi:sugar lactone lactonase YvrE
MKSRKAILKFSPIVAAWCMISGLCRTVAASAQTYTVPAAATSSQATVATGLTQVQAVAVDGLGNIFYTLPAVGNFMEQPAGGGAPITLTTGLSYPKGVAVDTHGYAYTSDYHGHLWKIPVGGGAAVDILTACNTLDAYYLGTDSVSTDAAGNVYTVGQENDVFEITPAGACSIIAAPSAAPTHVASDAAGNVYYSIGTTLYALPVGATTPVAVNATFSAINGLRGDNSGNLYVTDNSTIDELPFVSGAINASDLTYIIPGSSAYEIGVDPTGNLYTTDGTNIYKNLLGSVQFAATAVGTTTAAQTVNVIFNAPETLTAINLVAGTGVSTEIANTGAGTCAVGGSFTTMNFCTITLAVTPSAIGARDGAVQFVSASGVIGTAFVGAIGSGAGLVVDPGKQTSLGSSWSKPSGVAVDATGSVFVADSSAGTVTYLPGGNGTPQVIASGQNNPSGVAVAPNGTVYVVDTGAGSLVAIAGSGGVFATPTTVLSGLDAPQGVTVTPNGDVYLTNTGAGTVLRYPNQSGSPNFFDPIPQGSFTSPAGIAADANGNIFVTDRSTGNIVELTAGAASTIATGLSSPIRITVDPADDVYILQSGVSTVELIPYSGGAYNTNEKKSLGTGFTTPVALASDQTGNLYLADSGAPSLTEITRSNGALNLGSVDVGDSTAAQNLTLSNDGTAALTFSSPYYTASGNTGDFAITTASTDGCAASASVVAGANCGISIVFTPTASGARSEVLQFASNAANASGIQATLSGNGINLPKTTLTLALVSPTGAIAYGETVTLSAIVAPVSGTGTPTGSVQFLVNGTDYGSPVNLASGTADQSFANLPAGSNIISAIYSGDSNFAASTGTLTLAVALAPTTIGFTSSATSATPVPPGTSVTFTATISSSVTSSTPTGTVNFVTGTTVLGTVPVGTTGVAAFTSTTLPQGTYAVDAVYSGDTGFAGSTSSSISISILPAQFVISGKPTTLTVAVPGSVSTSFVVTPISGYTGGVDIACSGLPANTTCTFLPGTVSLTNVSNSSGVTVGPSAQTVQLTITTDTAPPSTVAAGGFLILPVGLLLLGARKRLLGAGSIQRRSLTLGLLVCLGLLTMLPLTGCGSTQVSTPHGSSVVTVMLTGSPSGVTTVPTSGTGNLVQTFSFTLQVN